LLLITAYSIRSSRNRIFLSLSLFFVWYTLFVVNLTITRDILQYPWLHRTGIISAYLAFPFLYIYSRNTFYPGRFWKKTDWLLLIPTIFYIIDFLPFFLMPTDQKIVIIQQNLGNNEKLLGAGEGWLGLKGFYFPFAYVWIAIIVYFQARLLISNWSVRNGFRSSHNQRLFSFIVTLSFLYLPIFIPGVFGVLLKLSWFNPNFLALTFWLTLSIVSVYLFLSPDIVYGFIPEKKFRRILAQEVEKQHPSQSTIVNSPGNQKTIEQATDNITDYEEPISPTKISEQETAAEVSIVLKYMEEEKPYLKQGFTIQELSNGTGLPVYQLSPLINGHFKMNFANWVNRFRIEYFIQQVPDNPQLTLEALSKKSGFISRSTFINSFKKEKGVTPREYFKKELQSSAT